MYSDPDKKVRYVFLIYMYTIILHYNYSTYVFNNIMINFLYLFIFIYKIVKYGNFGSYVIRSNVIGR
jgi:hypothetical protein